MKNLRIVGYGKAFPDRIVTNDDLSEFVDTSDEWILQRTGIKERRIGDLGASELAVMAGKTALENANLTANDIDLIICSTVTPDFITPSVACMVQKGLGITNNHFMAMDINAACTGYIFALKTAAALLTSFHKRALVIGTETLSRVLDFTDRSTCILFGDAAGAVVLEKTDTDNQMFFYTNCRGDENSLRIRGFKSNVNMTNKEIKTGCVEMYGNEVFKFALRANEDAITHILKESGYTIDDISFIIPHQANFRIIEAMAKRMHLPLEKFYINLDKYGNTSSASIATALCEANENKLIKKGDKLLLVGFGGGMTWGSCLIEV